MSYWWVNHKKTRAQEVRGSYLWSPKRNANSRFNQSYENMTLARPGDVVFSYADGRIGAVGSVKEVARSAAKPSEFGSTGDNWSNQGWLLPVQFDELARPVEPKHHLERIGPLLPSSHSPIRADGNGNQGIYLAAISAELGRVLAELAGINPTTIVDQSTAEDVLRDLSEIAAVPGLSTTEREQLSKARIGQGVFRSRVIQTEGRCRVTGVAMPGLLRASHIKPWRSSTNEERLDGNNGFLFAPHVDTLFDGGLITFDDDGSMLVSSQLPLSVLAQWGIRFPCNIGDLSAKRREYLAFHRADFFRP